MDAAPIFIFGCKVPVADLSSSQVLDPCNCSSYYELVTDPYPSKKRKICGGDELWNHKISQCRSRDSVLDNRLCNREEPWGRCQDLTNNREIKLKNDCISKGFYTPTAKQMFNDGAFKPLLPNMRTANLEMALLSMLAGSVITLLIVAVVLNFCRGNPSNFFQNLVNGKLNISKKGNKSQKNHMAVTEPERVSVDYEDIDEEEDITNSGHSQMVPKVKTSSNVPLPAKKPTGHIKDVQQKGGVKPPLGAKQLPSRPTQPPKGLSPEENATRKKPIIPVPQKKKGVANLDAYYLQVTT